MSQLTDEQLRRIEENRRRALAIRAAKASADSKTRLQNQNPLKKVDEPINSVASKFYQPNIVPKTEGKTNCSVKSSNLKQTDLQNQNPLKKVEESSNCIASKFYRNNVPKAEGKTTYAAKSSNFNKATFSKSTQLGHSSNNTFNSGVTKGNCILLSRKRFYVDVPYHKELIEIFKSIPNRLYDMKTKKWNFNISEHDMLISLVKPLQPDVLIVPLPKLILNTFLSAPEHKSIKECDLSVLDPVLHNALLPFQKTAVHFAVEHYGRVLIADDMGLGKTIQAIAVANYYSKDWPLLIVSPSSVRYSWQEAIHNWLPSVGRHEIAVINSGKDHITDDKVVLISYDLLTKMKESIIQRKFKSIIFDESHSLKNYKSARTKAAKDIMKHMNRIIMLSGTPALSRPIELYTQVSALRPKDFLPFLDYGVRYCNGKQMPWGWDFSGSSNMEELQLLLEEIVMIRRLKSDVIKQLPDKFRQMVILDPSLVSTKSKTLRYLHNKMQQEQLKGMEKRGALLEYFHETGEVKLKAVCEYVLDLLESEKKFICFAHHQNVINGICHAIESKKIDYIRIDGSVSSEQRKNLCDKFQLHDTCKVAVLSITSANCGITLTSASLVVFAELFWNPGILTQAEDRAHRIGQESSVVVQYLVAKGTADDEIWPLVQRKLDILNKAGLSKDNFKSADTIALENKAQTHMEDFWQELDESLGDIVDFEVPEKRQKMEI